MTKIIKKKNCNMQENFLKVYKLLKYAKIKVSKFYSLLQYSKCIKTMSNDKLKKMIL